MRDKHLRKEQHLRKDKHLRKEKHLRREKHPLRILGGLVVLLVFIMMIAITIRNKPDSKWIEFIGDRKIDTSYKDEYYYNKLNKDGKKVYRKILNKLTASNGFEDDIPIPDILNTGAISEEDIKNGTVGNYHIPNIMFTLPKSEIIKTEDDVYKMIEYVRSDTPEIIWITFHDLDVYDLKFCYLVGIKYTECLDTKEEVYKAFDEIDDFMEKYIEPIILKNGTDYEREEDIYNILSDMDNYDMHGEAAFCMYGLVLDRKAVCSGITDLFKYIDKHYELGFNVVIEVGTAKIKNSAGGHEWCTIRFSEDCNIRRMVDIVNHYNYFSIGEMENIGNKYKPINDYSLTVKEQKNV